MSSAEIQATPEMCAHCFDTLIQELHENKGLSTPFPISKVTSIIPSSAVNENVKCPLFVTWNKRRRDSSYDLRGCIGSLEPRPLHTAVAEYALTSALHDRRFRPIRYDEIEQLQVGVSFLVNYEECDNPTFSVPYNCFDWTVGKHGIIIRFQDPHRRHDYSATYLPEVAKEQSWTQEETIHSLVRKAGYNGKIDEALLLSIQCTRYQSSKCAMKYEEYVRFEPE